MPTGTLRGRYWGGMFPDVWGVVGLGYWGSIPDPTGAARAIGNMFPDPAPLPEFVDPIGPAGAATFILEMNQELEVTYSWQTGIFKAYNGVEKRSAHLDRPKRRLKGSAYLLSTTPRAVRAQLHRYASLGQPFLVGLPFESITLSQNTNGTSVFVDSAIADWTNIGQRVAIVGLDGSSREAVIQFVDTSVTPDRIDLDIAVPSSVGIAGGKIMPLIPLHLEPTQGFQRYPNPDGPELWRIDGRTMLFGFQKSPKRAFLSIEEEIPSAGNYVGLIAQARVEGAAGNVIRVESSDTSLSGANFIENGNDITLEYVPGSTTVDEMVQAVNAGSSLIQLVGPYNASFALESGDVFPLTSLHDGSDGSYATDGIGATLTTLNTRPIWDRGIRVQGSATDSLQAMNEILDLGGIPANVGQSEVPDWGRVVAIRRRLGPDFQWFKRFTSYVRGAQKTFYLPTWRKDLTPVTSGVGTLTIAGVNDASGAFFTWYPYRNAIQVQQADGTITYATISNAVDNNDGTVTLTIGTTLSGSAIIMVSWLEVCRFETDDFPVRFEGHEFTMATLARAVQQ